MSTNGYSTGKLTPGKRDFLQGLKADPSLRRWGMEQIAERSDALDFLRPMIDLGFFSPTENPAPVPGDTEGRYRIPRWDAMVYLEKAAADAGARDRASTALYTSLGFQRECGEVVYTRAPE